MRVYAFQDTLEALGAMHGHVYDDGDMFVLDLATLWGAEAASDLRRARVRRTLAPSTGPRNSFLDLSGLVFND